ncbi:DNA repair protein RAD50-like [Anneissia japonica]|uniref:DNA repair protein RAD50-like n=1 Tax=Anneissia japonica TaxID=1529436 RepID=UPI0014258474|nr:DNA repair protein RAD50-like [Anneissia japonica]
MSSINKLSIQGIRSFGQDDGDMQVVEFFSPLTLIVGQNGAGKTTIIECLKYITTGDMPPGIKGSSFVHDPKVADESEVKAQVKIRFTDIANKSMVVTRNLTATQKASRVEFKTLEGTIFRINQHGERTSTSSKCVEINREMETSLGVSKPVLNNVIFCHQEDSNWPLSEGKTLKTKFDEIFAATRYIKALESIRSVRKTQADQVKIYNTELRYLKENKDRSIALEKDLESMSTRLDVSKDKVVEIADKLSPLEERRKTIITKQGDIADLESKIAKFESDKEHLVNNQRELERSLEEIFQGTTDELRAMIREHKSKVDEKAASLKQNERKISRQTAELQNLKATKLRLVVAQGKLEQEAENHKAKVENRNRRIQSVSSNLNMTGFSQSNFEASDVNRFQTELSSVISNRETERQQQKELFEDEEAARQMEIDDMKATRTTLKNTDNMKTQMMKANQVDLQNIKSQLRNMNANMHQLSDLEADLKQAEQALKSAEESLNLEQLRVEIRDLEKEKQEKDRKMSNLNQEISTLTQQSNIRTQHEMLLKNKNEKESEIKKIRNRIDEEVQQLLGHFPSSNAKAQLQEFSMKKNTELKQCQRKLQTAKSEISSKETRRAMIMDQMKKKEDELRNYEERLFQECGSQDVESSLVELQTTISNLQSEKGALSGSKHLFERYIKSLRRAEAQCPLCHRGFDAEDEVEELVQELESKLRLAPQKMVEKENLIAQNMSKRNKLVQMKPLKENMKKLSSEIPDLKANVASISEEISKLRSTIQQEDNRMNALQLEESMANEVRPYIIRLEECQKELSVLERKLAVLTTQLAGADTSRTFQLVNSERRDLEIQLDGVNKMVESKRRQVMEHSENLQVLKVNINSITSEKLRLEGELQQRVQLENQQVELTSTNQQYAREIKDAREQLMPIERKLSELIEGKNELTARKERELENLRIEIEKINQKQKDIRVLNNDVRRYYEDRKDEKIKEGMDEISGIEDKISHRGEEVVELQKIIDKLKEDVAKQQVNERTMQDNLLLRQKQAELEAVERKLAILHKELGGHHHTELERERLKLNNEIDDLIKEKHQAEGRLAIFKERIKSVRTDLQNDSLKNAKEKHTDMLIKLKTTELASSDLDKYYVALNRAIMNYHSMKMNEINAIIRELWRDTYKGNDIDHIEIRADEDDSTAASLRRQYKYRVVLVKGDISMDMRGRCSAGQKVLASLVIRLALAETFCLNCGILALDEPTTNLDRANIESLASALVNIIKNREGQKNFQLIVITHDEEFVELLGRSDYVDHYYRVQKNRDFKSRVSKHSVETLNATLFD